MPELDPDARRTLADLIDEGLPPWHSLSVAGARRLEARLFAPTEPPPVAAVQDLRIDGDLPVRVYRPESVPAPTIVVFHGGGFIMGDPDTIEGLCTRLCRRAGALVVSVDYRLAPEHPFPAAVEDAYHATTWVAENAVDLGGDGDTLVLAGTSAGATLATVTALRARDDGPAIDHQVLAYPMTAITGDYPSREVDAPLLDGADVTWFWEEYLRSPVDRHHPYAAPMIAEDLAGVAPATVLTAGVDVLRDEGQAYADRLADAGVDVAHHHYPGLPHGFLSLVADVPAADDALDDLVKSLPW